MTDNRTKRELRADHPLRKTSKKLFGSQYTVEVGLAIAQRGLEAWTIDDLELAVADVPRSCINKEVKRLLDLGIVRRGKMELLNGSIPYSRGDRYPGFWQVVDEARATPDNVLQLVKDQPS